VSEPRRAKTGGTIVPGSPLEASIRAVLHGSRWLVVEGEPGATEAIVAALESMGCVVRCLDAEGRKGPLLGPFDAQIVLSDSAQEARLLGERLRTHPGLRWASVLRFAWSSLWLPGETTPTVALLATRAHALLEPDRALGQLVRTAPASFTPSVETLGPVRTLRALCAHGDVLRVHFAAADRQARVEVGGGLVLNATFQDRDGRVIAGEEAFAAVLELVHAEVTVERRERPEVLSLVAPVEEALALAMISRPPRFDVEAPRPLPTLPPPRVVLEEPRAREALASRPAPQARLAANTLDDERPKRLGPAAAVAGALIGATLGVVIAYRATRESPAPEAPPPALTTGQVEAAPAEEPAVAAAARPAPRAPAEAAARPVAGRVGEPPPGTPARELERHVRRALEAGETSQAVRWAERAVAMRKKRWEYRLLYGDALAADGQPERALRQYAAALARRPGERTILERIERLRSRPGT
jgi:hypothetical protein